ncbi:hypothetical protein C1J03_21380 [Sulfitobacter sp. SK012]|nr:hypothetical protein C1J03_21380 [Sulfitobacter sp. SK012]
MKYARHLATLVLFGALAACSNPARVAVEPPTVTQSVRISFRSVEVRDVSLPSYAAADEISTQNVDGALISSSKTLWADAPERAVALGLTRNLTQLTGARIASQPWPFEAFPDAQLEVRFAEMIAGSDGVFRTSGQYFVGVSDGRRERSGLFDLTVAYDPAGGPAAIARGRGQIILDLATLIARNGLS